MLSKQDTVLLFSDVTALLLANPAYFAVIFDYNYRDCKRELVVGTGAGTGSVYKVTLIEMNIL